MVHPLARSQASRRLRVAIVLLAYAAGAPLVGMHLSEADHLDAVPAPGHPGHHHDGHEHGEGDHEGGAPHASLEHDSEDGRSPSSADDDPTDPPRSTITILEVQDDAAVALRSVVEVEAVPRDSPGSSSLAPRAPPLS